MTLLPRWRAAQRHQEKDIHRIRFYSFRGVQLRCSPGAPGPAELLCRALVSTPCHTCAGGRSPEQGQLPVPDFPDQTPQQKCSPSASGEPCWRGNALLGFAGAAAEQGWLKTPFLGQCLHCSPCPDDLGSADKP